MYTFNKHNSNFKVGYCHYISYYHINSVIFILLGREVLDEAAAAIGVGVTTDEIDRIVHEASIDRECYPSPLNYYQFPKR